MKLFREWDLYKWIIFGCLLLLPVTGLWCNSLATRIEETDRAVRDAVKRDGTLEKIGALQKQVETVEANRQHSILNLSFRQYFERQILRSATVGLGRDDYDMKNREEPAQTGSKQRATDHVVEVVWGKPGAAKKDFVVPLQFIENVIFNLESAAKSKDDVGELPSVWKLRKLSIENVTGGNRLAQGNRTPPPELEDVWAIQAMEFVRREPKKDGK